MKKFALISMHPAPYRDPVLSRLANSDDFSVDIFTLYPGTTHPEWKLGGPSYDHVALDKPLTLGRLGDVHRDLLAHLRRGKYDGVVVPGRQPLTVALAALYAKATRRTLVYQADTTSLGTQKRRARTLDKLVTRVADAIWTTGTTGRSHWEALGYPSDQIFEGAYTLDADAVVSSGTAAAEQVRSQLELDGKFVYLFVGHYTPGRRVPGLVEAFLAATGDESVLVLIGSGEQWDDVTAVVEGAGADGERVRMIAGVPFNELHGYYAMADAYVHPGAEPYSLALQEAALFGLPIVASIEVGATVDYVEDGVSGIKIVPGDQAALRDALVGIQSVKVPASSIERARARGVDFAAGDAAKMLASF